MEQDQVVKKIDKLVKKHEVSRWISLSMYAAIICFGFYLLEIKYSDLESGVLFDMAKGNLHIFLTAYGGSMVGVTLGNWSGSSELKLLKEIAGGKN